jgi:TetR/AcrR family transcriptional regulator, cholesterol catabolism regulator
MDNRQRIVEEAAGMFRTFGIRAVTMDMLASRMGISKRTIYEVFGDKDELVNDVIFWMGEKQRAVMAEIMTNSDNVIEAIFKMLDVMKSHFINSSAAFHMDIRRYHFELITKMGTKFEPPFSKDHTEIIKRGIAEGIFRPELDVDMANACMLGVMKMANDKTIFPDEGMINKDIIGNFYLNYLRGISTPKGLELICFHENNRENRK